ncbi:MAG TPA: tetraacyldisaccharide 4'-kinase [Stellaceae bacterium]|nr:tetraacyldisaccharide 4'-kinase [Stellaceae bacterium]
MITGAPDFWSRPPGFAARLLTPFGGVWHAFGHLHRAFSHPYQAPVPVICVGNLVAGGAGKTPVVLSLADWFTARGVSATVVTRGYGGTLAGPLRIDPQRHVSREVGDEALLIAERTPCWIARNRAQGVRAAALSGADTILLDDGFQNPTVDKTLSLIVVDAAYGFGNGRVIPAGPLREGLTSGLARAAAVVLIGVGPVPAAVNDRQQILRATLEPLEGWRFAGRPLVAFAGIGRPEKFFAMLRGIGAQVVATRAFPDHHPYIVDEIDALRRAADRAGAQLVTTKKDIVRVPPDLRGGIEVLEVEVRWTDPAALERLVAPIVRAASGHDRDPAAQDR